MTLSRIPAALCAAFIVTGTAKAHDLGNGGSHFHVAESQGLAAAFPDHPWLVLTVAVFLMVTGLVLRNWKRS
ncbi:MAG: hypothetical protein QF833_01915 [Alphaproteobacteria bacterium]|nr:hypothetical protein [Alphaproteobacteria bacterium]